MAHKKVLITGSTGLLGLSLIRNRPNGFEIYGGYYDFPAGDLPKLDVKKYILFDIKNRNEVRAVFDDIRPDTVVHSASIGNVDYCETHREEAWQTNVEGSRNIMDACRQTGAFLVFTSSNAIFDGNNPPYKEGDRANPLDYYGKTKLETEKDLTGSNIRYSVARLITMYGWNHPLERQNPATWVMERLKKNQPLNIVNDIFNNHLFVDDAAQAIWAIIAKERQGAYNIGGGQIASRYELACGVADIFGLDKALIAPVSSSFFPSIAPRPKNSSYNIDKMKKELGVVPVGIREGLAFMKNNLPKEWRYGWL